MGRGEKIHILEMKEGLRRWGGYFKHFRWGGKGEGRDTAMITKGSNGDGELNSKAKLGRVGRNTALGSKKKTDGE